MMQQLNVALIGLLALAGSLAQADHQHQHQGQSVGPGCDEDSNAGSHSTTVPKGPAEPLVRVRRQLFPLQQQPQQPNPLGFLTNLGPQVEQIQGGAKMFSSLFSSTNPNQFAAASQLQQAFQPQQQQPAASASALMGQLSEMVRSAQDKSGKLVAGSQQALQGGAQQALESGQQQAQQAQGGIQSALTEIGQGLQKIATNNPSLLPDIKNLYSSVSSKLSSAQQAVPSSSFPSNGPIVPAKNGDQLLDNLGKVALGQTQ